jgi:hypothetical protein
MSKSVDNIHKMAKLQSFTEFAVLFKHFIDGVERKYFFQKAEVLREKTKGLELHGPDFH